MQSYSPKLRLYAVYVLVFFCSISLGVTTSRAEQPSRHHAPQVADEQTKATWTTVRRIWTSIKADEEKSKQFFAPRYYMEVFESGAPPLPYRAYYKIVVERRKNSPDAELVVKEQGFLPVQDYDGYSYEVVDYHGVHLEETESTYALDWSLKQARFFRWGCPSSLNTAKPSQKLRYGTTENGAGYAEITRSPGGRLHYAADGWGGGGWLGSIRGEGDYKELGPDGLWRSSTATSRDLPDWRVLKVLLSSLPEAARGINITCMNPENGQECSYAFLPFDPNRGDLRTREGSDAALKTSLMIGSPHGWHYFGKDIFACEAGQCTWIWRRIDAATYKAELKRFLQDHDVKSLQDRNGKVVELPIGIGDVQDR